MFLSVLTKIGNGTPLEPTELDLIESRFVSLEEANRLCPDGIRLFFTNDSVNRFNQSILNLVGDKIISVAEDQYTGYHNQE